MSRSIFPLKDLLSLWQLVKLIKNFNPDIVHTHTSKAGVLGRLAVFISRTDARVIHTYHGHLLYGYFPSWKLKIFLTVEKILGKITDKFVAVSNQVKHDLLEVGLGTDAKWRVILPGLEPTERSAAENIRSVVGVDLEVPLIGWIGRFSDIKDPMLALETFSLLSATRNVSLIMAGDGDLLPACQEYAKRLGLPVHFLGWVDDISDLLSGIDLLLMTSKNEGLPLVVVEAGFMSVPTVSPDVGGVKDYISNQINGVLTSRSSQEIYNALLSLIDSPEVRKKLGAEALRTASLNFNKEQYVFAHLKMYREIAETN
jgi:glycosyltransferase involved in cell wall biosynthesis